MAQVSARTISESSIHAVITRADGTVENLGLISFRSRNPLRRWGYQLGRLLGIWRR
jgi:hypothetical protein